MDWKAKTVQTYDDSAAELADYFKGIGARIDDIEAAIKLAEADKNSRVVEIGCGDGRDAAEIVKRVGWYEGVDPSKGLLEIAKTNVSNTSFVVADALTYEYPENIDVIYAFASLLHLDKTEMLTFFDKALNSLRKNGILFVSLKERETYIEEVKSDKFGERMFYFYNPKIIRELAGDLFEQVYEDHQVIGHTDWFTIALKKI